jgi:hypothetical protein
VFLLTDIKILQRKIVEFKQHKILCEKQSPGNVFYFVPYSISKCKELLNYINKME